MEAASRASGWYKVEMFDKSRSELAAYDAESGEWVVNGDSERYKDKHFSFIGEKMVMMPNGAFHSSNQSKLSRGKWPTMTGHALKILPEFFNAVCAGIKTAELRKNDRGYKVGDALVLMEWDEKLGYTGRMTTRIISDVCDIGFIAEEYVMLSMYETVEHINVVLIDTPQFVTVIGSL